MDATDFVVQFSSNYPAIVRFTMLIAAFIGAVGTATAIILLYKVEVSQMLDRRQFGLGKFIGLMVFSSLTLSIAWTLDIVGNSAFNYGGYILTAVEGSDEWRVREGVDQARAMKEFFIMTSRVFGLLIGLWGAIICMMSMTPNAEQKLMGGVIRLVLGAAFIDPVTFLNFFGGAGDKYLAITWAPTAIQGSIPFLT
ncbi:hypothetical protein [Marinimicrobium sp. ABcell2]|uniref:hypothetical protein n=1 Tax=Marinimicrobium sp. ABcell2 TaxID=3069751 RepID=UPI0027B85D68|nr:hypothetical protein [Marinimicrobium sp. ABcell2]MDQ2077396.1 hypothetical protein [Marinimicrobium sp. ABcell2]